MTVRKPRPCVRLTLLCALCVCGMFVWMNRVREWRAGQRPVVPAVEMIYLYHGFRCQNVQLLQRCLATVEAELAKSPYWHADKAASDFDVHDSDELTKSNHGLLVLLYASLVHHLSRPVTAARHLEFLLEHKADLVDDFYLVPFAQFELATIHLEQLQRATSTTSSASASSDDNQLHAAGQSDEPSTAPPPTAELVREEYRLAAGYREKYHFKNRLHLRIHLAVTELKRLSVGEGEGEGGEDDTEGEDAMSEEDRRLVELARKTEEAEEKEGAQR